VAKSRQKSSRSAHEKRAARAREARVARRRVGLERETRRRLDELFAEETPVTQTATRLLERFGGAPVPRRIARVFALAGSEERAREVSAEAARLAPDTATALTLEADVAFQIDDDARSASALLDRALAVVSESAQRTTLAGHMLELGRVADALATSQDVLLGDPADEDAEVLRADALELAQRRINARMEDAGEDEAAPRQCPCWSGRAWSECCRVAEEEALQCFGDREALSSLRGAMRHFAAADRVVGQAVAADVARWLEDADASSHDEREREGLERMATEHAWLVGDEEDDDQGDARDPSGAIVPDAPLALLASEAATAERDRVAARRWLSTCQYGLWQVADPTAAPGVWLTDIVTGTSHYASIPLEQLDRSVRWTVLLGPLVAIDGTWRTASAMLALRPREADEVAELVEEMTYAVVSGLSGRRIEPERSGRRTGQPLGVLAARSEPAPPEVADLVGKVIGSGMPRLVAFVNEIRDAAPRLQNTDRDPLCLVKATVRVGDTSAARRALAEHPDIEADADELVWWGRELDEMERATSLAEVRSQLRARGESVEIAEPDGPRRWLRGRIGLRDGAFEVDVNSKERFERFLALLRELGEEPKVSGQLVIDPALDLPQLRSGTMLPFAASEEASVAWLEHWPDQKLPTLGGRTPRRAARSAAEQPRLEALLRELEHDVDLLAHRGLPAPDVSRLRTELRMPAEAWR
jgi:hypothetical protein